MSSVQIPLSRGKFAIVDAEDADRVQAHAWHAMPDPRYPGKFSASFTEWLEDGTCRTVLMHRFIVGAQDDEQVDHENQNTLDNQRKNLRTCTPSQNGMNRGLRSDNTTGFKGVGIDKWSGLFRARIGILGKRIVIGLFATAEEAAHAYDEKARELHGRFARLNFPIEGENGLYREHAS